MMLDEAVQTLRAARFVRKLRIPFMYRRLSAYLASMSADSPLKGVPVRVVGDAWGDPTELFSHYDAFGYWVAARLARTNKRRRVLDIGSPKKQNAILSAFHDVSALVLADCGDQFSAVHYLIHDVTLPLPFSAGSFDCFTSAVTLNLVGLGRYGDRIDANGIPNLISELDRVMSDDGELLISVPSGPSQLAFNNHWCFDIHLIQRLFKGWRLESVVVDGWSSPSISQSGRDPARRFVGLDELPAMRQGDYRVVFCAFVREASREQGRNS
ncbi:DUF268 domain-containing protein [Bradyrhizobium sp. DASA03005]|uniref:DUF268 domain-containing protein n=1 Tax=Bradyrhizobium TaxID=374 RepID=UPI00155F4E1E|nr:MULTISPECIES: DUF268 domain-containing protein [Bradyrhizobium]MDD1518421.1 hypothetical protein [Bradyrhizobium sp. WBAH30]MDD1542219.1 hypothetical protein [Bradyrhizobium sp. WBAH41]MDD1556371.1 hypothetical protein [Bradyrhizobium sp. WBAH23]MDD1561788.1 hypothetical protein [Bradyrhizobium sp. WBAH33]MDD1589190.1 hypothetical protein [Bradyrhizobium sp. WBAH42]